MGSILASTNTFDVALIGVVMSVGMVIAVVAIITDAIRKVAQTKAREESRREIAAYVAEGTISPDDAAKLLAAGGTLGDQIKDKIRERIGA